MMNRLLLLVFAITSASCSAAPKCQQNDAQGLVAALQPEQQFRAMLDMTVRRTQTFAMANARDSSGTARKLNAALDRASEKHSGAWQQNLVRSWSTLQGGELQEVCAALANRDQQTFVRYASRLGASVKAQNEPLLRKAGVEVLAEIWE